MTDDGRSVVIIGGGQGGHQAAISLRELGFDGAIRIVGDEIYAPYQRPPLSKEIITQESAQNLAFSTPQDFEANSVEFIAGQRAITIDRLERQVELDDGHKLKFGHLVLATGARNRILPISVPDGVCSIRGIDDALDFRERLCGASSLAVIGAGFLGLEVAAMAAAEGLDVAVIEATAIPMGRALSAATADGLVSRLREKGIRIHTRAAVAGFESNGGRLTGVRLDASNIIAADVCLISIGVLPNCELAATCGLAVENGVVVDAVLRTADRSIYAIGDCAAYSSVREGRVIRLESVQNAVDQGRHVARAITGQSSDYNGLPWFWSEQGDVKLQIAGLSVGVDETVTLGDARQCNFSTYCFRDGVLVAVESVNRPADHMSARKSLTAGKTPPRALFDDAEFDFRGWVKTN